MSASGTKPGFAGSIHDVEDRLSSVGDGRDTAPVVMLDTADGANTTVVDTSDDEPIALKAATLMMSAMFVGMSEADVKSMETVGVTTPPTTV